MPNCSIAFSISSSETSIVSLILSLISETACATSSLRLSSLTVVVAELFTTVVLSCFATLLSCLTTAVPFAVLPDTPKESVFPEFLFCNDAFITLEKSVPKESCEFCLPDIELTALTPFCDIPEIAELTIILPPFLHIRSEYS